MKIELRDVAFAYEKGPLILDGITLELNSGESVAVIGQNGSGKTTLVKQLSGILKPVSGDILFDGASILPSSVARLSRRAGYVFQNPDDQLFLPTVQKELEFGPRQLGMPPEQIRRQAEQAADICALTPQLEKHPLDLSASEKKFCTIGSVLSMNTDLVILDEPTMGQDRRGVERLASIVDYLKREGKLCVTISHDMKFVAAHFGRVIVLKDGQILLDGTPEEVFSQPEMLRQSYLSPPPVTRVCQTCGLGDAVFTLDAFEGALRSSMQKSQTE